jgi:hypothetical protein
MIRKWIISIQKVAMTAKTIRPRFLISSPPWLIIGAAVILIPIFIFMTYEGIRIQNELTTKLLVEKGNALIRSFEAGIRSRLELGGFPGPETPN